MGIIGIVAALTLPNLNSSTGDKEKVVKLKKIYQNLEDAMGRAQAVYGPINEWPGSNASEFNNRVGERLIEFIKTSKNCQQIDNDTNCFMPSTNSIYLDSSAYKFITADGTSVAISSNTVYVDIDGPKKGSNSRVKDIFSFDINKDTGEITPTGNNKLQEDISVLSCACFQNKETSCTAWVIQYENMDYLKCPEKLSFTNTTCK